MSYRLPRELYRRRWQRAVEQRGEDHPEARAAFGRYVASLGAHISPRSGQWAWVAWSRARGGEGYWNRAYRRHLVPDYTVPLSP